ncbi:MAG: tRNA (adenosine(37)-N6)-threonylcarbamoyltransferase complex dimerization subunit type 1 TsaB [Chromatiales bacterium]|nr:tRNA (adenosine(37)-N6)-threonylcarbamoyltransferase complex dimerization subunit type 1 TsaB [Chromatiales bacterium]MDH4014820.1 tRNA (adenosine(37)-N6)-threonylcarbamoyltransferase complex dimerization subunit type 1 TsaB [Chromatiales bacterium]
MSGRILALETATEACSVAVLAGSAMYRRFEVRPRAHLRLLLPMVESVLTEAELDLGDLDAIAFGCGPGGFTGLRIAAGAAQGLALGARLPVIPVSNLAALAASTMRDTTARKVIVCQDARMGEVYWGTFDRGADDLPVASGPERVGPPEAVSVAGSDWLGAGSGWLAYPQLHVGFAGVIETNPRWPDAADVAAIALGELQAGRVLAPELAAPTYIRNNVTY